MRTLAGVLFLGLLAAGCADMATQSSGSADDITIIDINQVYQGG